MEHISEIIKEAFIFEENNKPENKKRIVEPIEHMISLYNKGMASKEIQRKNIAENSRKNLKLEKEECSFKLKNIGIEVYKIKLLKITQIQPYMKEV